MWAKCMSAWLCATACAGIDVWGEAVDDAASLLSELLHAPITATAASAAIPVATVLVVFTNNPFVPKSGSLTTAVGLDIGLLVVL